MKRTLAVVSLTILVAAPAAAQHEHHVPQPAVVDTALARQLDAVRRATERYRDHANAVADGYKLFGGDGPLMGEHWYRPDLVKQPLDISRPATLQYANIHGKRELVGVAFNVYQRPGEVLPEGFSGASDHWHVHDIPKLADALVADRPLLRRAVQRRAQSGKLGGGDHLARLVMLHVWVWSDNPDGMFAQQHRTLPYLRAGLPADWAKDASVDAAWGVSLLRDGCARELERLDRLANLSIAQRQKLNAACQQSAEDVRASAGSAQTADQLNARAGAAWKQLTELRDNTLTREQKRRLGAVMEPMIAH
jgi:hypothetical protein